jgi:PadR family transcriptional regulator, regulatory protein PadR
MKVDGVRITPQTGVVLKALLAAPSEGLYGLQIAGVVRLPTGSIYPILARLEHAGWINADWEPQDQAAAAGRARRRRYYWLTHVGRRTATAAVEEIERTWTLNPRLDPGGAQA